MSAAQKLPSQECSVLVEIRGKSDMRMWLVKRIGWNRGRVDEMRVSQQVACISNVGTGVKTILHSSKVVEGVLGR